MRGPFLQEFSPFDQQFGAIIHTAHVCLALGLVIEREFIRAILGGCWVVSKT